MKKEKIKILFISKHVVHNNVLMAGHKLFNYNLKMICANDEFEVGYIVVQNGSSEFKKMKNQFHPKAIDFSIKIPLFLKVFTYLYYHTYIRTLFSFINPRLYYLDYIYNFFYIKALKKIKKTNWAPDIINFEWTEVLFLFEEVDKLFKDTIKITTEHDVSFLKLQRKFGQLKQYNRFLTNFKKAELEILKKMHLITVLSINDFDQLQKHGIVKDKLVLLNPFYKRHNISQKDIGNNIVYYGAMNRVENQEAVDWFIKKVFIPYKLYVTNLFIVIGAGCPKKFEDQYRSILGVTFTGFVSDPKAYFETALCMVVPLINGGGIKIKILEAMSCSVTVLTNNVGIEGIDAISGTDYLHCLTPENYYLNITHLTNKKAEARYIGENGRRLVEDKFNYEKSFIRYEESIFKIFYNS